MSFWKFWMPWINRFMSPPDRLCAVKGAGDRRLGALATKREVARSNQLRRVARPPAFLHADTDPEQAQEKRPQCTEQGYGCGRSSSSAFHRTGLRLHADDL